MLWTTRQAPLQCTAMEQHGVMLMTECGEAGNKIRRTYAIEDIIYYFWPLAPNHIGFYQSWGHLLGLGTHCNYSNLS
jgi:hypothetical protein